MIGKDINSIGLVLDIIGVLILFRYGLPSDVNKDGVTFKSVAGYDEKKKYIRYKMYSKFGLGCLCLGFFFQLVSNHY